MSKTINTKTTLYESLSTLSRAIPKIAERSIGGYDEPVVIFDNPIFINKKLTEGMFLYKMPDSVNNLEDLDIENVLLECDNNYSKPMFLELIFKKFLDKNNIKPVALIENIEPGLILWYENINQGVKLYYESSILPKNLSQEISEFINNTLFMSPNKIAKDFIISISYKKGWKIN